MKTEKNTCLLPIISLAVLLLFASVTFAQNEAGVLTSFNGTLSTTIQEDHIAFNVDADQFELNSNGRVDFLFLMSSVNTGESSVDPGRILIKPNCSGFIHSNTPINPNCSRFIKSNMHRLDTATSTASIALASVTPGMYSHLIRYPDIFIAQHIGFLEDGRTKSRVLLDAEETSMPSEGDFSGRFCS